MTQTSHARDAFQIGDLLNNTYRIESVLGRGGTSEVYRARSEISGRVVALKALRTEFSGNDAYLALMRREEEIREVRHDGIVRYYDNQRTDTGQLFLVMDYVEGPGLDAKMREGGLSIDDLMIVAERVADALGAAHAKGITHRDLSPDNIILRGGDPNDPVIIDFGIAKDDNPDAATVVGGEFAGKYSYAAPEQLRGQADARSDIYALGALLLATHRGGSQKSGETLMQIVEGKAHPLDTSDVPEPLRTLVDRMTAPDPDARPQNAAELLSLIRGLASTDAPHSIEDDKTVLAPLPVTPTPSVHAPLPDAAPAASPPGPEPTAVPASRGRGGLWAAIAVLAVAAAGGGYYFLAAPAARLPVADPYVLTAERAPNGIVSIAGVAPDAETQTVLSDRAAATGGTAQVTLARGDIPDSWGADVAQVLDEIAELPEWRLDLQGTRVEVTGLASNRDQRDRVQALLDEALPAALTGGGTIALGPRILPADAVRTIIADHSDCGDLTLIDPPSVGYAMGASLQIGGTLAKAETGVALKSALRDIAGDRTIDLNTTILNPAVCAVQASLPAAPSGGASIDLAYGDGAPNPAGRYLIGDNPVIDIVVPAAITEGYLYVIAVDVSGSVFHLLPNLFGTQNDISELRQGVTGDLRVRVAYPEADAAASNGQKLAFLVDDSALGDTEILALITNEPLFDGLRPTTESASGLVEALNQREGTIQYLDTRILTTAAP